ncbi:hypothetical protein RvY_15783 [Ramazzottius varieornatus]|uniref:DDE-1 domain-containing protein n=1 Tax=Ramazzottius varieornatus TaxID=947166 RepID=A0A1D1VW48_RAMVA|nr:hypothetical protein RvY_15783 [Ramazzottius varieornatus]
MPESAADGNSPGVEKNADGADRKSHKAGTDAVMKTVCELKLRGGGAKSTKTAARRPKVKRTKQAPKIKRMKRCAKKPKRPSSSTSGVDEDELISFLKFLATVSWDWKLRSYKSVLQRFAEDCGSTITLSYKWRSTFAREHKDDLPPRVVELFSAKKAQEGSSRNVTAAEYFDRLAELYGRISTAPECIWNLGSLDVELPEPLKKLESVETTSPEHVSAIYAISAAGELIPATLLFKGSRIAGEWKSLLDGPDKEKVLLMVNSSGKYDPAAAIRWLRTIFTKAVKRKPVGVFLNETHCLPEYYDFLKLAYDEDIHLVSAPKKLNSVKLPLDVNIWGPTKDRWYEELDELQMEFPAATLTRPQVVKSFAPAYSLLNEEDIKDGFASCGIFPLNPNANPVVKKSLLPAYDGEMEEQEDISSLSEVVEEAFEMYERAGLSRARAKRLLRNMNVPGFETLS